MKNFVQTPKQRRVVIADAKTRLAHSAPRQAYAHSIWWRGVKSTVGGEPLSRLHTLTTSRTERIGFIGWW